MCGIAGFVSQEDGFDPGILARMRKTLAHRGPDDAGEFVRTAANKAPGVGECAALGLAHCRLSILDLSQAGRQPMSNEDGRIWISYNGEFYNFGEYRQELEQKKHIFRSRCDTETLLHLYEDRGIESTLNAVNGMFAFALWDENARRLFLARDRAGKKPLYYLQTERGGLLFASEIKALLASGQVDRTRLDLQAMDQFWTLGYSTDGRTIFEQIRQIPPGHYGVWQKGRFALHRYWTCPVAEPGASTRSTDDWADELEALLADAIRLRLISDVPVGLFLSAGVDSSLIAALTSRKLGVPLHAFTIAFDSHSHNEAPLAADIAARLGLPHEVLKVTEDIAGSHDSIARQFDEPFGDVSCIPTYFVAKQARRHVTVALTGDAGDELFAGYEDYALGMRLWGPCEYAHTTKGGGSLRKRAGEWRLRSAGIDKGYSLLQRHLNRRRRAALFSPEYLKAVPFEETYMIRARWMREVPGADALGKMQYADRHTYLPDDVLVKVDRMSMAHSLECRSPLLDHRVMSFAASLPLELRMTPSGEGKVLLRRLLARYLPAEVAHRAKTGFTPPWTEWCRGAIRDSLRARWEKLRCPLYKPSASEILFPRGDSPGPAVSQWQAFSMLNFLEAREENQPQMNANGHE